ncbi:hypothetical protein FA95DRAFT_1563236 [Auriscalpium vulgare]|uniref:Uncharacterized protein n=1 Tax=Auriscalpium vulgare TaxID=40419 RepID=A0ACB8RGY7_9AGAM|nr:hypothetical protein FA95DRAFT_1563236 [Auriscalpium vulgare]
MISTERELAIVHGEPPGHVLDNSLPDVGQPYSTNEHELTLHPEQDQDTDPLIFQTLEPTPNPDALKIPAGIAAGSAPENLSQSDESIMGSPISALYPDSEQQHSPALDSDAALLDQMQSPHEVQEFNFSRMEEFIAEEKQQLESNNPTDAHQLPAMRAALDRPAPNPRLPAPRSQGSGRKPLFQGSVLWPFRRTRLLANSGAGAPLSSDALLEDIPVATGTSENRVRPYRFSFSSSAFAATIHGRSLAELPAEGQSFQDLFSASGSGSESTANASGNGVDEVTSTVPGGSTEGDGSSVWWLDVFSPTDGEMRVLGQVFGIHPLTLEDIQMEEAREKIQLFQTYYLVCFRSFDQDPYSPTYLEPLNMYFIVFREGILSFHFRHTPHPQNVRRRIKQLKNFISVTSDWISYALIDDITDSFGPLVRSLEYEVDSIDELILILKKTAMSDMLRRIGVCWKKVMGLLRLMRNKGDVVKDLAKRCNENLSVAQTSDIGLYLADIEDHLITMTQNLSHYEKVLSRAHANYLAKVGVGKKGGKNQVGDVLQMPGDADSLLSLDVDPAMRAHAARGLGSQLSVVSNMTELSFVKSIKSQWSRKSRYNFSMASPSTPNLR